MSHLVIWGHISWLYQPYRGYGLYHEELWVTWNPYSRCYFAQLWGNKYQHDFLTVIQGRISPSHHFTIQFGARRFGPLFLADFQISWSFWKRVSVELNCTTKTRPGDILSSHFSKLVHRELTILIISEDMLCTLLLQALIYSKPLSQP